VSHPGLAELEAGLAEVLRAPRERGRLEAIARRPAVDARELLDAAELELADGLVGDGWLARGSRHTADRSAERARQVTVMNARLASLVAGGPDRARWALAGDQLYVDLDLGVENLPAGSRLAVGAAVLEVSEAPHLGCGKFAARFGRDALRFVNSPEGRAHRLRGLNARIVVPGRARVGDEVAKLCRERGSYAVSGGPDSFTRST